MGTKIIFEQKSYGTVNGIAIQRHLEEIYKNLISETFGARAQYVESKKFEEQTVPCMVCGSPKTYIMWCKGYSGYRGRCISCKHNWPES